MVACVDFSFFSFLSLCGGIGIMKARLLHDLQLDAGAADKDYFCLLHISLLDLILWNPESCASALELQTWSGLQQGYLLVSMASNFLYFSSDTIMLLWLQ